MAESFNPILGFDNRATPDGLLALVFAIESFVPLAGGRIERVARFGDEHRRVLLGTVVNNCSGEYGYSVRVVEDRRDLLNVVAWPDHVDQRAPVDPKAHEVMWEVMQPRFTTPDTLPANYLLEEITSRKGLEGVPCAEEANAYDNLIRGAQPTTTAYASRLVQIRPGYEIFAEQREVLVCPATPQRAHTCEVSVTLHGAEDFCSISGLEGGIPGVAVEQVTGMPLRNPRFRTNFQVYDPGDQPLIFPYIPAVHALTITEELLAVSSDQNNPGITL